MHQVNKYVFFFYIEVFLMEKFIMNYDYKVWDIKLNWFNCIIEFVDS